MQGTILVNDKTHETFGGATFSTITTLSTVTEVYRDDVLFGITNPGCLNCYHDVALCITLYSWYIIILIYTDTCSIYNAVADIYCWRCLEVEWLRPSWVIRRNFALSTAPLATGTGIPDPFILMRPPEEGVASLLSLALLSIAAPPPPSGAPPSAPRIERLSRVGTLSFPDRPLRPTSA